jgi:hypothetical protein
MPIPPPNPAPYDTLATVTALTRTVLADYINNLVPNPQGTCNTNGQLVTWVSGAKFSIYFNGMVIVINNVAYQVQQVTSATTLTLTVSAGVQAAVAFVATIVTGDIFGDNQNYVLPTVILAWRKLQKKLADRGHPRLENEADIFNLPVITNLDPISQQWINWTGFFDGTNFNPQPNLPSDFISPLRLWERQSTYPATPNLNILRPMKLAPDALYSKVKGSWNRLWDWREDAIYFPGAILGMDLRIRYAAFLADLAPAGGPVGFGSTPVPIMRSADALAYYSASLVVEPRGGVLSASFDMKGDMALDQITNAFAKLQQRTSYSRRPWGARGRRRNSVGNLSW